MAQVRSTTVDAQTSLLETATATETKKTPSGSVADPAQPMLTTMVSVMTSTIASANWMNAAFAMVLVRCMNVVVNRCLRDTVTAQTALWMQ